MKENKKLRQITKLQSFDICDALPRQLIR